MKNVKTSHVALILDRSGSMGSIKEQALQSFNDQIEALKKEGKKNDLDIRISIVLFNDKIKSICFDKPIEKIDLLTSSDYLPANSTALFDAMGQTLDKFKSKYKTDDEDSSFLFVIITDGMENSSIEYSGTQLKEEIEKLKDTGKWTFTFMGTEDALAQATEFKIANTIQFDATPDSFARTNDVHLRGMSSYYSSLATGEVETDSFYDNVKEDKNVK